MPHPRIHGYQLGRTIHASAMTVVVQAIRTADRVPVVLKYPAAEQPSLREVARYRHEHALLQLLDTRAVVPVLALEQVGHRDVLVCEDLHCVTLSDYFLDGASDIAEFLRVAVGVARALVRVHEAGIIHKDINPANVVITPVGTVRLIDFGISTRLSREPAALAHPVTLEGTLAYMSPEQTGRMNCAVDARSDLYSLGVTFYALLANRLPFESEDPVGYVHAHIAIDPPELTQVASGVPPVLASIVAKLMAKSADDRYQSAAGLLHDLDLARHSWQSRAMIPAFTLGSGDQYAHFEIPHALYGREAEVATLLSVFSRVALGRSELLLVGGYSGIGKSALVNEVQKPIVAQRGYFAAGKFEQYNRNVPYSAVSSAFRDLVHYVLMEPQARVERWRKDILEAVGVNGRVLLDVVPALELLIGPQPALSVMTQIDGKNRFEETFRAFVAVLARAEHPLVLFFDDVQWADIPSLHLLETLLADAPERPLLVIVAYRDNEVDAAHPALIMADQLRRARTRVSKITLGPLALLDVNALIADALHVPRETAEPLSELLHGRTGGNPFFLVQLLQSLEHDRLLTLDSRAKGWTWDFHAIREHGLTGDVIELMATRLRKLPGPTTELLKFAACMGSEFDLNVLAQLVQCSFEDTEQRLWPALAEELVVPAEHSNRTSKVRRSRYRFLHDRVQQAAYALLDDHEREIVRAKVGWLLLAITPEDRLDSAIFDIVAHLNLGLDRITEPALRKQIALLNVRAAQRAKAASAHKAAATNYAIAMQLLGPELWTLNYTLAYDLHRERADCEYLSGQFDVSEQLAVEALAQCRSTFDSARVYSICISMAITRGQFAKATELGLEILRLFGYDISPDPARVAAAAAEQTRHLERLIAGVVPERLLEAPEMQDVAKRALMEILSDVWCATYFSGNTQLNAYTVDLMTSLSLEYGNTPVSAFAYTVHGMHLGLAGHARRAYEFGALGIALNERLPSPVVTVRVGNMFANTINPFVNHLETNLQYYRRSYELGPRVGEIIYTVWAVNFILILKVTKGDPLSEVYDESTAYLTFIRQTNDHLILNAYTLQLQMIRALRGLTPGRNRLEEGDFSEASALAIHVDAKFWPGILFYAAARCGVHVVFRDFRAAVEVSRLADDALLRDMGFWTTTNHFFYQSLALCNVYFETADAEGAALLEQVRANLGKISAWAEHGADNFAHRRDLVAAELARCEGDHDTAARLYDLSLEGANAGRFVNDAAVAAEAASYFHRARGSTLAARGYLAAAHYAYMRWGADAKVNELRAQFPELQTILPTGSAHHSTVGPSAATLMRSVQSEQSGSALDFRTAMKAAQALSSEMDWNALVDKLLHLCMENAGARAAWLILNEAAGPMVVASAAVGGEARKPHVRVPLAACDELPTVIVQYVERTLSAVVLRNAHREGRFREDPWVIARQPRSVACVPLATQGRCAGVLYLEHRLADGAFSEQRVDMLQLITAQAAISLENAALYANMEARVQERTLALDTQNARMRTLLDNVGQGFLLARQSGALEPQYSRILEHWFGVPEADANVWDYLFGQDARTADIAEMLWGMLSDPMYPLELTTEQLPARIKREGRDYDLAYQPLLRADQSLEHVVIVVTDVTLALIAERAESGRQELADVLDRALSDRAGFREFVEEGRSLIAELTADDQRLKRALHTLKANCELWQMKSIAALCHAVESRYADNDTVAPDQILAVSAAWSELLAKVAHLLSRDGDELGVRASDYKLLLDAVLHKRPHHELESLLTGWTKEPVTLRFSRLAAAAERLGERLGKPGLRVVIEASELRSESAQLAPLWAAMAHLLRNAIDHGIEQAPERVATGKSASGCLTFRAYSSPEHVVIELADDGRGIDWAALAVRARQAGLAAKTPADLQRALFADGVTTRDQATEMSGRGLGLSAVQEAVQALGGTIEVRSQLGRGTCFSLQLPAALFQGPGRGAVLPRHSYGAA